MLGRIACNRTNAASPAIASFANVLKISPFSEFGWMQFNLKKTMGHRLDSHSRGRLLEIRCRDYSRREGASIGVTVNSILAGPTESEGVGGFVEAMAVQQNKTKEEVRKEFFDHARPSQIGRASCR